MKLYINDTYVHLTHQTDENLYFLGKEGQFSSFKDIKDSATSGPVFLKDVSSEEIGQILSWIEFKKIPAHSTIHCFTPEYDQVKAFVKSQFRIIKAAGGLVRKGEKFLLIYRLGKWDLPKGKLEKDEKSKIAAVREVMEECGVEAELVSKLCTTWHSYIQEGKRILKKSTWYTMNCIDDSNMEPQYVENIEDLRWMTLEQAKQALRNSYRSIKGVFEEYESSNEKVIK